MEEVTLIGIRNLKSIYGKSFVEILLEFGIVILMLGLLKMIQRTGSADINGPGTARYTIQVPATLKISWEID